MYLMYIDAVSFSNAWYHGSNTSGSQNYFQALSGSPVPLLPPGANVLHMAFFFNTSLLSIWLSEMHLRC